MTINPQEIDKAQEFTLKKIVEISKSVESYDEVLKKATRRQKTAQKNLANLEKTIQEANEKVKDAKGKELKSLEDFLKKQDTIRREYQNKLKDAEDNLATIKVNKKLSDNFTSIVETIGPKIESSVALAGKAIVSSTEMLKTQAVEQITELATTEKGMVEAYRLMEKSIDDGLLSLEEIAYTLGDKGENFKMMMETMQKNEVALIKEQQMYRRQGLSFEIDIFNNRTVPLKREQIIKEEENLAFLEKKTEENERILKREAKFAQDEGERGDKARARIQEINKEQDLIFDETQKIKDKGIKINKNYEKSMFNFEAFENMKRSLSEFAFMGKTLGERRDDIGDFFAGITPQPIQDLFRQFTGAFAPAIGLIKEFLKPLKLIPFTMKKAYAGIASIGRRLGFGTKSDIEKKLDRVKAGEIKQGEESNKVKKDETGEIKEQLTIREKLNKAGKKVGGFFRILVASLPLLIGSVIGLGIAFFTLKEKLRPLLARLGLMDATPDPSEMSGIGRYFAEDAVKTRFEKVIKKANPQALPFAYLKDATGVEDYKRYARKAGVDEKEIEAFESEMKLFEMTKDLRDVQGDLADERGDVMKLEDKIGMLEGMDIDKVIQSTQRALFSRRNQLMNRAEPDDFNKLIAVNQKIQTRTEEMKQKHNAQIQDLKNQLVQEQREVDAAQAVVDAKKAQITSVVNTTNAMKQDLSSNGQTSVMDPNTILGSMFTSFVRY